MAGVVSRDSYFETGLDVLSDLGYGGLKLAEVCNRLGVTTGSFGVQGQVDQQVEHAGAHPVTDVDRVSDVERGRVR